jgi:hypothetical protein
MQGWNSLDRGGGEVEVEGWDQRGGSRAAEPDHGQCSLMRSRRPGCRLVQELLITWT